MKFNHYSGRHMDKAMLPRPVATLTGGRAFEVMAPLI